MANHVPELQRLNQHEAIALEPELQCAATDIESPGLTASLAIERYVGELLRFR